nr:MAG TPA: hypothetical protein [Caudoviricetes sp.]
MSQWWSLCPALSMRGAHTTSARGDDVMGDDLQ